MTLTALDWFVILLVPAGAYIFGRGKRKPAADYIDYFLARRALSGPRFLAAFMGANLVFTALFLVLSFETLKRGWWVLAVPISFFIGTAIVAIIYPKLRPFFEKGETLHQALGRAFEPDRKHGWGIRKWAAVWTIFSFVGLVAIEFYGGVLLFRWSGLSLLHSVTIALLFATICAAFTISGGIRGVANADIYLDLFSFVGIGLFCWYLIKGDVFNVIQQPLAQNPGISLAENIIFCIASLALFTPMPLCALDTWQRGVAWKERQKVSWWLLGGALGIVIVAVIAMMAGFYARAAGCSATDPYPFATVLERLQIPPVVYGIVIGAFIAAILSTADELLNVSAYAILADIYQLPRNTDVKSSANYIRSAKFYTGVLAFIAAFLTSVCALAPRITDVFTVVASTQVVFTLPLLLAIYRTRSVDHLRTGALIGMLGAFLVSIIAVLAGLIVGGKDGEDLIVGAPILAFIISCFIILTAIGVRSIKSVRRV
ncbi:MAG: hypothetical protein M1461_01430 [Nitrospirae bacterium]|nr:hypothetical protein [Nitrospirota bacterium]